MVNKRYFVLGLGLALLLVFSVLGVWAAGEPEDPDADPYEELDVTFIVGFGAGGSNDVSARFTAQALRDHGINVDVVNMTGGMGADAAYHASNLPPAEESMTFFWSVPSTLIFEPAIGERGYTIEDFDFVGLMASPTYVFATRPHAPFDDWQGLVEYIEDNPGELTLGGQGHGGMLHFMTQLILPREEYDYEYVGFAGGADVATNLIGDHVEFAHLSLAAAGPLRDDGELTPLVNTQTLVDRDPAMPDVPNITEINPDIEGEPHGVGLYAPKGTDPALIDRITSAMAEVAQSEDLQQKMQDEGMILHYLPPEEHEDFMMGIYEDLVPMFNEWHETLD